MADDGRDGRARGGRARGIAVPGSRPEPGPESEPQLGASTWAGPESAPPGVAGSETGPKPETELGGMAWPEVAERPLVLVPVGATEQHGPHLPLDTDSVIAAETAAAVAARLRTAGRSVVVTPVLAFGASGEHQSFAGTVSIGQEALRAVVIELVRSLSTWAGRIVIVNGHGGNMSTLVSAVPQLTDEGHDVSWVPCAPAGAPAEILDAHAGRLETSLMLFLRPGSVRQPLPGAGDTRPMRELLPILTASGVGAVSPSGVLGDPTGATADEGEELFASLTAEVLRRVLRARPDARGLLGRVGGRAHHAGEAGSAGERGAVGERGSAREPGSAGGTTT